MNKDEEKSNANRALGSVAFYTAARSEIMIHRERNKDGKYTGRRMVGLNKGNNVPDENPNVLVYHIVDKRCDFEAEPESRTIEAIMAGEKFAKGRPKNDSAIHFEAWIKTKLERSGKIDPKNLFAAADANGVSRTQVYKIATKLGLNTNSRKNGGMWVKEKGKSDKSSK